MAAILTVIGDCDRLGNLVEPFDHVLMRYNALGTKHEIVLPRHHAGTLACQLVFLLMPKRPD